MAEYSAFSLLRNALTGNQDWKPAWRKPDPKASYDVIVIGGGGHGLSTAYYLAKEHGITNVAVLEKGWLGSGNVGRNTTAVRSNYLLPQNTRFYEHSMKMWENLSHDLNYNVMFSQRGCLNLAHTPAQLDDYARRGNAMRHLGVDAELMSVDQIKGLVPALDVSGSARFPVLGGLMQPRAGTARHDAVAWGYARGADRRGVDIIENCEVTGFLRDGDKVVGVTTTRGEIRAKKVALAVAGSTGQVMQLAGISHMPIESHVLQAFVTESLKPIIDTVLTFGMGHFYISQSDKGGLVYGGDLDGYNSYAQRGSLPIVDEVMSEMLALFPGLARVRMLRSWGGLCDMTMDGSPIITTGPLPGMYLNCGWCYGGFKATPASGWCFAWTIARDEPHEFNAPFTLDRFHRGLIIDDKGQGATPRLH
ncbi:MULTISPECIES: sarcosine oxidase subunit beta [unclassified Mesorhizobium]|uniref:sarcosine oxidase subunit beta n=1 Tax=unclassified Mesorhizobium TaxID=325217 RepID=UPI000FCCA6B6|nr:MULTISPECIES: sarcosine oxidase subunit beta [unclassified Mesorhizobium]TIT82948.1 MAG: sarcosine oxidase subunit beta family protein [Mesorhizobium sp.]TGP26140.1 sarcosine oxidase subunit beta [Mesorhizobium sp. M1D.F.Ca.ET.231.01.1.1]TGP38098.1 sarcosine oxidase subunit beta [Mesorhizobium sp. M1D.F.Ca.ET.234.01.1.1]TGS50308.1 sarcosine oxidase subunit beta [Mesorhizobium sp. M1D.F.Ca.ET.184.01.1.1]TGS66195.1 sarcosine oxidase subunit beta [Mesorhizobium sp. M1D.F.Ca.ET.183.01.1.1]